MLRTYSGAMLATRAAASLSAFIAACSGRLLSSNDRRGIRPEQLQKRCALAQLRECCGNWGIVAMTVEVDEEQVLPQPGARRTRFEPRHAHAVLGQRLEQRIHRTRPVLRRHHERGLIPARGGHVVLTQHPEA